MNVRLVGWSTALLALLSFCTLLVVNLLPGEPLFEKPIPHVIGVDDPAFARTMESMFASDVAPGHAIQTLVNGEEIFPSMLEAIGNARSTINFLTYIYWSGDIARRFAEALAAKAREGVEVRVLVDWLGSLPFDQDLIEIMTSAGVRFDRFRPLRWYSLDRLNNRTHRKILVVDGRIGFTGGVGIADVWAGDARNPQEWRDNHYRIEGPAVLDMQAAFAENWVEATGEVLQGARFYPPQEKPGDIAAQHVKTSPSGGARSMHQMILMSIAAAERHIRIAMAYFVPDEVTIAQLLDARARGVEVDVIVPGRYADVPLVRKGSRHFWGELLAAGVRIHEYQPTMYHPKVMIIDDRWTTIGSANLDERSFRLNDESNLNVYDETFARTQIDLFNADLAESEEVTLAKWQARPWREKLTDWMASLLRTQL